MDGAGDSASPNVVEGLYSLQISGTPEQSQCGLIPPTPIGMAPWQGPVLQAIQGWWQQDEHHARANLNFVLGDFLGEDPRWPIVQTAAGLNRTAQAPQLSLTTDPTAPKPVTVSCNNPTIVGPTTMVVYPVVQGPHSPNLKTFTTDKGSPGVQGSVSLSDFPGALPASDGSYVVAACARGGSPLDPPGSSSGVVISRIVIPLSAFGTLPLLGATPADAVDLPFTCFGSGTQPVQVTAYPAAAGPNSPDAQVFVSANGQPTLQATYGRRGSYDVRLDCLMSGGATRSLTVPASAFPPALAIRKGGQLHMFLYCDRDQHLTSPATLSLAAQTLNAPAPLSVTGSDGTLVLNVNPDYFPNGDYQLTATCASSDTPPFMATPLTLSSSQIPMTLRAIPSSGLQLAITCVNPQANGIHAVAYPAAAGPNSPDAQMFDAPAEQSTLLATYSRRANYDVRVDCSLGGGPIHTVTVLANAFPPALAIRKGGQLHVFLYCDRHDQQLTSPATLSLAAQTPNAPAPLSVTGTGKDSKGTIILPVLAGLLPAWRLPADRNLHQ